MKEEERNKKKYPMKRKKNLVSSDIHSTTQAEIRRKTILPRLFTYTLTIGSLAEKDSISLGPEDHKFIPSKTLGLQEEMRNCSF